MIAMETRMIEFPINAHAAPGYLARAADGEAHPGVVVIQEWWAWCRTSKTWPSAWRTRDLWRWTRSVSRAGGGRAG